MNRYSSERDYGQHEGGFRTHRSERYRHPERDSGYRFDDYGSSARGGYGNEGNWDTRSNQGDDRAGGRSNYTNINITDSDTYSTSRNYGNMGSYGGAQGFGDIRGGHHDSSHPFDSGTGSSRNYRDQYGSSRYREEDRGRQHYGGGRGYEANREDLYGHDVSRRFQGSRGQDRYDFERDDYYSSNYGDDQGNYMGSGYHRTTQSSYGTGDYGSMGYMEPERRNRDRESTRDRESGRGRTHEFNTARNRWNTDW